MPTGLTRRAFIVSAATIAGSLAVGFRFGTSLQGIGSRPEEILNWVKVGPNNLVTIRIAQVEMGQGTMTAMAKFIAEELDADWSLIRPEYISLSRHLAQGKLYGRTETSASAALRESEIPLRTVGAQIKAMLVRAAADRFREPSSNFEAQDSFVTHRPTGTKLSYGELATDASHVPVPDAESIELKSQSQWKYIGKSKRRLDIPSKVSGSAAFGIDVRLPGMKYAAIAICPKFGGRLKSYDARTALAMPGVRKIVEVTGGKASFVRGMDDAVAIVADEWWQAKCALDKMSIEWEGGEWKDSDSAALLEKFHTSLLDSRSEKVLRLDGDVNRAISDAAHIFSATYSVPYLDHAVMEPINCTALVTDRHFEIWAPTQHPEDAIKVAAKVAGLPVDRGELHLLQLGGGFGRRIESDFVSQSVQIAKVMKGTRVKLLWTREATTRHGFYRRAGLTRFRAGINASSEVTAWDQRIITQYQKTEDVPFGSNTLLYNIPNIKVSYCVSDSFVPVGAMRGIGYSINCFGIQSFVDELADFTGQDSYQFQRALLNPHMTPTNVPVGEVDDGLTPLMRAGCLRAVLDEAAKRSRWGAYLGSHRGRGIAVHEQAGGFYAVVVEVTLDNSGWFTVDRVIVAGDPGQLNDPCNARAQIEGSVAFGLTAAIYGKISIHNGGVIQSNFHDYQMLRIDEMPDVEVHWVLRDRRTWGDVSQAVVSAVQPALTNAIYNAGGPRIRSLPIKDSKIFPRVKN